MLPTVAVQAKLRLELSPCAGVMIPITHFGKQRALNSNQDINQTWEHAPGGVLGGRVTAWFGDHAGIELGFIEAKSDLKYDVSSPNNGRDAKIQYASVRMVYMLDPPSEPSSLFFQFGVSQTKRSGEVYRSVQGANDVGGVIGGGARFHIARRLVLRVEGEDYISHVELKTDAWESDGSLQNEFVFSISLALVVI